MNSLFLILFFLSGLCLIIGLIRPSMVIRWGDPEKRGRKQVLITYISIAIVSFVAFGVTADKTKLPAQQTAAQPQQQPQAPKATPEPTPVKAPSIEEQIEKIIKDATNDNFKKATIAHDADGRLIVLTEFSGKENLTTSMTRKGTYMYGADIFQKIYSAGFPIKEVKETIYLPLVDKYGNSADEPVVRMTLKAETAKKINWEGVDKLEFAKVADTAWTHPALMKN